MSSRKIFGRHRAPMTNETFSTGTAYTAYSLYSLVSLLQLPLTLSGTHGHTNQWSQGFGPVELVSKLLCLFAVWTDLHYWSRHFNLILDSQATSVLPENMSLRLDTDLLSVPHSKCLVRAPPRRSSPYGLPQGLNADPIVFGGLPSRPWRGWQVQYQRPTSRLFIRANARIADETISDDKWKMCTSDHMATVSVLAQRGWCRGDRLCRGTRPYHWTDPSCFL